MRYHLAAVSALFLSTASLAAEAPRDPFFDDGRTDWKIYLSPRADPTELFAAEELTRALHKISAANFEVVRSDTPPARRAILLGDLRHPEVQARAAALKLGPGKVEQIAVATLDDRLYLAGNQPRAVLYAVYHFLRHALGVRWFWPGADGEFIPARKRWHLPELRLHHTAGFAYRGFHLCGDWRDVEPFREWMARNGINIHRHAAPPQDKRRGFYSLWSSHNVVLPEALFEQHPEYFAEIGGKRYRSNLCFSNPEVDRLVAADTAAYLRKRPYLDILSVFPADNQDFCRCARCARMDISTAWFEFYNRLTDTLKKDFPHLKYATIAYQGYRDVPRCTIRNSEFIEYASYSRCNIHPYGHPGCRLNEETMRAMLAWKATGLPIGHYAYEYDLFSKNGRFLPFLSVIADAVRTSRKLGHLTMIPEVSLSPRHGPDVYADAIQNRLSLYLYARLLWDPDQPLAELLADWCRTVFAEAAPPMLDYYTAIDRAWTAMPIHATILGNALTAAPHLLTGKLRRESAAAFAAAQKRLPDIADPTARQRAAAALQRERILFNQWLDLDRLTADTPRVLLPLLARAADFPAVASRPLQSAPAGGKPAERSTRVRLAWTRDALLVRWSCHDARLVDEDRVELVLSSGLTGETWHLAVNGRGVRQDWRLSEVGVREEGWGPAWQATSRQVAGVREIDMVIPFASLGQKPNPAESWQARFLRHDGGRTTTVGAPALLFTAAARADRSLLWWAGAPDREGQRHAALLQEFTRDGWHLDLVADPARWTEPAGRRDAYWFRHPHGPNKVPAAFWDKHLVPAVKDGALAVFVSYWPIPLDQYFRDPALKVNVVQCGRVPLAGRTTAFVAPGDWSKTPHNLLAGLREQITPAYGFVPADAAGWTVLATAKNGDAPPYPYLLARRYGKGMIVVGGDDIRLPPAKMLANFLQYAETAR